MNSTSETPPTSSPPEPPVPPEPPEPPEPPAPRGAPGPPRLLRRSDTNRVAAGVAGGLGEYFGVDPVIFRVLFAVSAFFGGAGILAYVIAWAAIPERGGAYASIDRLVGGGGRSSIPRWILTVIAVTVVWGLLFGWWAPWRFLPWMFMPLLLATLVLAVALTRRPPQPPGSIAPGAAAVPHGAAAAAPGGAVPAPLGRSTDATVPTDASATAASTQAWIAEARAAARERRHRAVPVRLATLGSLVVALVVLGIVDATTGIAIPVYFWVFQFVIIAGLVVGAVLRRPIWWMALLLIPGAIGQFVFLGCRASLHDGSGENIYRPQSAAQLKPDYDHAFGRTTLDLTNLPRLDAARTVHIRLAGGQVRLIVPPSLPVNVHANVHLGDVQVDGREDSSGMGLSTDPILTASDRSLNVDVDITAGDLQIDRR